MSRLLVTTALLSIFIGTGMAEAQYVSRYETSDQPSVEINLDVLNDVQEQQYNAEHNVTREPLPVQQPAPVMMRPPQQQQVLQPAPVVAEEEPAPVQAQPRAKRRLLKPILTARTPVQDPQVENPQPVAQEEMPEPAHVVKHSVIMPSESDPDDAMAEMQAQSDAMLPPEPQAQPETVEAPIPARKPEGVKRSWSAVDGTPAPYDLPQPPQQQAKADPVVEAQSASEPEAKPEVQPEPQPEPEVAAAPEPAPVPAPKAEPFHEPEPMPELMPAPVMAQADTQPHVSTNSGAIISHRPRYSNETGAAPQMSPPVVTQQAPVVSKPPVMSAPIPHRKPQTPEEPIAVAAPPAAVEPVAALPEEPKPEEPKNTAVDLVTPPSAMQERPPEIVTETAPETPIAVEEPPVVPTIADLTLDFDGNSSDLTAASQKKLDNVIRQMSETIDGRLQVRGFAHGEDGSSSSARRIALSRALSVRSYLMDKGVKPSRVDVMAKGSETDRTPKDRVDLIFAH